MPQNGGTAKLYGLELAASKRLQDLPGIWSNFGVTANLTLQHSQADSKRSDQPEKPGCRARQSASTTWICSTTIRICAPT